MATTVLHQWHVSPFCNKVRKLLGFKGVNYQTKNYNGFLALKAAKLTPAGKLPVLEIDNHTLCDSSRIAEYLEAQIPKPAFYPNDNQLRNQALFWENWADESLFWYEVYFRFTYPTAWDKTARLLCTGRPRFERMIMKFEAARIYKKKLYAQGLGCYDKSVVEAKFFKYLKGIDLVLQQQAWLIGDAISIADFAVAAQLEEMLRTCDFAPRIMEHDTIMPWLARINEQAQVTDTVIAPS